jgi:hypothetical protein
MVARHDQGARAAAGALLRALLCALLCALPASAQWDMEGRAQVVGLSDMKAMKALRLLGRDMAPLVAAVEAAGASGAPRAGQPWCNLTTYGHGKSRLQLCAPTPPASAPVQARAAQCLQPPGQRAQRASAQHSRVPATRFVESWQGRAHAPRLVPVSCTARPASPCRRLWRAAHRPTQRMCAASLGRPPTLYTPTRTPSAAPAGSDGPRGHCAAPPQSANSARAALMAGQRQRGRLSMYHRRR